MTVPVDDGGCFACGPDNPIGLHLQFEASERGVRADVTLRPEYQGWKDIAHGGIAMMLLDEAMAHAAGAAGHRGVTASVNVRFRKPVPIGKPLVVTGRVLWQRRNILGVEAEVHDDAGRLLVRGDGHFASKGSLDAVDDRRTLSRFQDGSTKNVN
jgi:uncharacterized protein (TIGR00369 family)